MPQTNLHDLDAWRDAVERSPRVLLFKHSPICPVSAAAHSEWERFRAQHPDVDTLFVDVVADKPVARGLAALCGVPHASPQVILFRDGQPCWDASHGDITAGALAEAWASA